MSVTRLAADPAIQVLDLAQELDGYWRPDLRMNWWSTWGEIAVQDLTCIKLCTCTLFTYFVQVFI